MAAWQHGSMAAWQHGSIGSKCLILTLHQMKDAFGICFDCTKKVRFKKVGISIIIKKIKELLTGPTWDITKYKFAKLPADL
jgi:hypothetical protein